MQNKKNALIVTVGTRDVQVDLSILKEKLPEKYQEYINPKNNTLMARKAGEFINQNYDTLKKHIKIPIIEPTLKYLQHEIKNIDYLLLIATDQETPRDTDTYYYAEIIKKYIAQNYGNVSKIEIFKITSDEVVYLDKMYKYIHGVFQKNKNLNMLNDYENIYLHLVGGIDAINTSIRFNAIQKLGTKIQSELHVNEDTGTASPIQSIRQFLQSNDNNTVRKMIKGYLYEGINELEFVSDDVKYFAQYAHYRMMFNFEKARHALSKVNNHNIRNNALRELNTIIEKESSQLKLQELFWNVDIKYRQKNYVDFLVRFFRLIEEILVKEVVKITQIEYTSNNWEKVFENYLKTKPELKKWLDEKDLRYKSKDPSSHLLKELLFYFQSIEGSYLKEDYQCIETAYCLQQMRNKSIGAHSFEAPDEEEIKSVYETQEIVKWLKQKINISEEEKNPYDIINQTIEKLLNENRN